MSGQFLSPIQFVDTQILKMSFEIDSFGPVDPGSGVTVTVTSGFDDKFSIPDPDMIGCKCTLEVISRFEGAVESDVAAGSFSCSCSMGGIVAAQLPEDCTESERENIMAILKINAVSMLYAEIRSNIEWITARSPIGKQILPAINPQAYLEEVSGKASEDAGE